MRHRQLQILAREASFGAGMPGFHAGKRASAPVFAGFILPFLASELDSRCFGMEIHVSKRSEVIESWGLTQMIFRIPL
jgi:hypothetical protein